MGDNGNVASGQLSAAITSELAPTCLRARQSKSLIVFVLIALSRDSSTHHSVSLSNTCKLI